MAKNKNILPIGLKGREINERMISLMGIKPLNEEKNNFVIELTKLGPDGKAYAIVRENRDWVIKTSDKKENLIAEDFNYIGGLLNRKFEVYPSYAKAIKQLNLKFKSLAEAHNVTKEFNIFQNDNLITESGYAGLSDMKGSGFSGKGNMEENSANWLDENDEEVEMTEAEKAIDAILSRRDEDGVINEVGDEYFDKEIYHYLDDENSQEEYEDEDSDLPKHRIGEKLNLNKTYVLDDVKIKINDCTITDVIRNGSSLVYRILLFGIGSDGNKYSGYTAMQVNNGESRIGQIQNLRKIKSNEVDENYPNSDEYFENDADNHPGEWDEFSNDPKYNQEYPSKVDDEDLTFGKTDALDDFAANYEDNVDDDEYNPEMEADSEKSIYQFNGNSRNKEEDNYFEDEKQYNPYNESRDTQYVSDLDEDNAEDDEMDDEDDNYFEDDEMADEDDNYFEDYDDVPYNSEDEYYYNLDEGSKMGEKFTPNINEPTVYNGVTIEWREGEITDVGSDNGGYEYGYRNQYSGYEVHLIGIGSDNMYYGGFATMDNEGNIDNIGDIDELGPVNAINEAYLKNRKNVNVDLKKKVK